MLFLAIFLVVLVVALFPYLMRMATLAYSHFVKSEFAPKCSGVSSFRVLPKISVILPVYNEEKMIVCKMQNLLALKYPENKFEIVVVDGCSTDKTVELVLSFKEERIVLLQNGKREGVTQATKDGVQVSTGDVVILTDAEAMFEANALQLLAGDLEDQEVGAITGIEVIVNPGENLTTRMEYTHRSLYNLFSVSESIAYSTSYFRGEFAAIRKPLFPMSADSEKGILDVEIALSAIRSGYRAKCDPRIRFFGLAANTSQDRNRQKIQRATLNQECILKNRDLLFAPNFFGRVIFPAQFAVHVISPFLFLASALLLPLALLEIPWLASMIALSVFAVCCLVPKTRYVLLTFVQSQVYLMIGFIRAKVFGRPTFLKQVESTRRHFEVESH